MTRADLLEVVYRFYPRGLLIGTDAYNDSEERKRQTDATRRGIAGYPAWRAMVSRLGERYTVQDDSLSLLAGWYDSAYSGFIVIPGTALGFHVCLLGPYYGIPRTGAPGEEPAALDLAREIEATYPGYEPIPPEIGNEVVPDLMSPDRPTIYRCLLSNGWDRSSGPWPPPTDPSPYVPPPDPGAADVGSDPPIRRPSNRRLK